MLAKLQFNGKLPPVGTMVDVRWGAKRSVQQNKLYFLYLRWLIEHGGLREHGHFSEQGLHESLKQHFLSEKIMKAGQFKAIENYDELTTTSMNKVEFGEYLEKAEQFMSEFFGVDSSSFWQEYKDNKEGVSKDMMELSEEGKAAQARGEW